MQRDSPSNPIDYSRTIHSPVHYLAYSELEGATRLSTITVAFRIDTWSEGFQSSSRVDTYICYSTVASTKVGAGFLDGEVAVADFEEVGVVVPAKGGVGVMNLYRRAVYFLL